MTTTNVENWPGYPVGIQGLDLMQHLLQHAERFNTKLVSDPIHTAKLDEKSMRLVEDAGEYTCDSLIIATGVSAQYLGLPSEEAFRGAGDGHCHQRRDGLHGGTRRPVGSGDSGRVIRSRVTSNCLPTSSSVWAVDISIPKRMRSTLASRGVRLSRRSFTTSRRSAYRATSGCAVFFESTFAPGVVVPMTNYPHQTLYILKRAVTVYILVRRR